MPYHVYHTEALVLGSRPSGEGDKVLYCYTRELGLVALHAKSLREQRSRLRYALQTFAHAEIDLIRGKRGWKLISARAVDPFASLWRNPKKRRIAAAHAQLLRRLIQGEERHEVLFDDVLAGFRFLSMIEHETELGAAELVFVVRMLAHLGYWGSDMPEGKEGEIGVHVPLYGDDPWNERSLDYAKAMRTPLVTLVNRALAATQL